MVTTCDQNSGIRFDVSLWPSQKIEIGYAKHGDDGKGGCDVDLRGVRLGLNVESPKNESLTGVQIGLANRTGDVSGLNIGILFNDIGKAAGLNVGLLWNNAKVMNGVQVSLLSNYAVVANGSTQLALGANSAGHVYDSAQLALYKNDAIRLDGSVQLAGISNFAYGLIHAAQLAVGINSTEGIDSKSFQCGFLLNMAAIGRDTHLAFLRNVATHEVPSGSQYALFNF